jgi:micrococcal nuclease
MRHVRALPHRARLAARARRVAAGVLVAITVAACGADGSGAPGTDAPLVPDRTLVAPAPVPVPAPAPVDRPEASTSPGAPPVAWPADAWPADAWRVIDVIDGDTIDVRAADGTVERVRIIGIDTPERGQCGYGEAAIALADVIVGVPLVLTAGARDDRDRYQRLLRYVDALAPDGARTDAGLVLLELGLARARYDSRDGYGAHPREARYVAADRAAPDLTCGPAGGTVPGAGPGSLPDGAFRDCAEARAAGAAPVRRGEPGYGAHLDGDGDGIGCE